MSQATPASPPHTETLHANAPSKLGLSYFSQRSWGDWVFAALVFIAGALAWQQFHLFMDGYEKAILIGTVPSLIFLGWLWRPLQKLMGASTGLALLAIWLYQSDLYRAEQVFGLKYFLSSQSAILWMCVCFALACVFYWISLLSKTQAPAMGQIASKLTWVAVLLAVTGSLVRWYESYLIGTDVGHIPVSNLYEVFVLFCWFTALFYLYFEERYAEGERRYSLGAFVMLIICAAVGFLLWYSFARDAQQIQPLVPALQSWWMKLHVPANFIGYGTFSLAAMVAFAYLVKVKAEEKSWLKLAPLFALGVVLCLEPLVFRKNPIEAISSYWAVYFGVTALITGGIIAARRRIAANLPSLEVLDGVMYKAITIGFAFFTIATILGAFWAAEAWGGYWSWDPKETWALIVWLNYAAWLHLRLMKGMRGNIAAWWALVGLAITTFAFLGVNMFLSGLHSYGTL
ncbi:MAG: c-type cytochrome biogenesis protein CcsB [Brachymonas sp.]